MRVHLLLWQYCNTLCFSNTFCNTVTFAFHLNTFRKFFVTMQNICTYDSNTLQSITTLCILIILIAILCNITLSTHIINALLINHAGYLKVIYIGLQYIALLLICNTYCIPLPDCAQYYTFYCSTMLPYRYFASVIPISAKYCSAISFAIRIALLWTLSLSISLLIIYFIMREIC